MKRETKLKVLVFGASVVVGIVGQRLLITEPIELWRQILGTYLVMVAGAVAAMIPFWRRS